MKKVIKLGNGNLKVQTVNQSPTKTQQQFKDQCDVNHIMKKYAKTGEITHLNIKKGQYLDMSDIPSYDDALNIVIKAQKAFDELPSGARKRFNNNPAEMLSFLQDEKNTDEAIKLGLKDPKPIPTPTPISTPISEPSKS